jgi:integrase
MGRKPSKNLNLPPRMRARRQRSGKLYYYYDTGNKPRREIPLGDDYVAAVRKWSELEIDAKPRHVELITFRYAAEIYQKEALRDNQPKTQKEKLAQLKVLYEFFDDPPAPLEEIKPIHIRQFLDWRIQKAQDRLRALNKSVTGDEGKVAANRDKALISHIWNKAREKGLTDKPNPCLGIKGFRETGRDIYIYDDLYLAVWKVADVPTQEAMDLTYLSGARPADVLKIDERDLREGFIEVKQNKTSAKQRIAIEGELRVLVERIQVRKRSIQSKVISTKLLVNEDGQPLTYGALRSRFDKARNAANIEKSTFQFRDLRAKAGTDKTDSTGDIREAQKQLGHASLSTTEGYIRKRRGEKVTPTK